MAKILVDYVSDLHLSFYIKAKNFGYKEEDIEKFIKENISSKAKGEILVIAGDLSEFLEDNIIFLKKCLKYYKKVFYIAGNHEYYLSSIISQDMKLKYVTSIKKIYKLIELLKNEENIIFLDRLNPRTRGFYNYKGFLIAGDTLWYYPQTFKDWYFYYIISNDSRFVRTLNKDKKKKIKLLNNDSLYWYKNLPNSLDLIVTHIPPIYNPNSPKNKNSCYFSTVDSFKAPIWIYGHDHIKASFEINNTRFFSNPWGYDCHTFPIETIELSK